MVCDDMALERREGKKQKLKFSLLGPGGESRFARLVTARGRS